MAINPSAISITFLGLGTPGVEVCTFHDPPVQPAQLPSSWLLAPVVASNKPFPNDVVKSVVKSNVTVWWCELQPGQLYEPLQNKRVP
jgi:hypothetical protein